MHCFNYELKDLGEGAKMSSKWLIVSCPEM